MFVSVQEVSAEAVAAPAGARQVKAQPARPHCSRCLLREWCLPSGGLASSSADCRDNLMFGRRRIRTGESLYQEGEPFKFLYEVRSGNLKSSLTTARGKAQVSGFHMAGELMGLDGFATGHHASSATALEDTEVCAVSYAFLTELAASNSRLQRTLLQQLSREIVRDLRLLVLLGSLSSERRLAAFLLNLSQRLSARGYSPSEFRMRMSRADIGSYLGLTLETVSRGFSAFQKLGLLEVDQRHIRIADLPGLTRIGDLCPQPAPRRLIAPHWQPAS